MADIFLSYARADQQRVSALAAALEEAGYSVWWDRDIAGGSEFSEDIEREMAAADAVVVAWSADAVKSHWVRDEASYARDARKLVPISLDGAEPPIGFRQVQVIDFARWKGGRSDEFARLCDAIARCQGQEAVPASATPTGNRRSVMLAALLAGLLAVLAGGWWWMQQRGEGTVTAEAERTGVAVLPFRTLSDDPDDAYFTAGLTEEIRNRLAALPELQVTASASTAQFAQGEVDYRDIASRLGVGHVVEGSVRRNGEDWRVSAQLVRADDQAQLWSDTYDATGDDILDVQSEIAERAAEALGVLLDDDKRGEMASVGISNPEAYALFARAMDAFGQAHNQGASYDNLEQTNRLLDRAFDLEPRLWNAQIAAVDRYSHLLTDHSIGFPVGGAAVVEEALSEIQRRLALARETAPRAAYPAIDQQMLQYSDDWSGAKEVVRKMLAEDQACTVSTSYDDWLVVRLGLVEEYIDYARRTLACNPMGSRGSLINMLIYADRAEEAIALAEEIENPSEAIMRIHVVALLKEGRIEEAKAIHREMDPKAYYSTQAVTWIAAAEGDREALQAQYEFYVASGAPDAGVLHVATLMGDREKANAAAARIDARPAGYIWLGNSSIVTCHCGNGFNLEATPNFRAKLIEAGASLEIESPIDWPLQE